jgi:predicted ester cyclase
MSLLEDVMALWEQPVDSRADPVADFRAVYADPVMVNGVQVPIVDLVARARAVQAGYGGPRSEIVQRLETSDKIVVGFWMHGTHTGDYATPLGVVPPTGRQMRARTIDILSIVDGRIADIWVVSDDLGVLMQLDAVTLRTS